MSIYTERVANWFKNQTQVSIVNITNKLFPFIGHWEVEHFGPQEITVVCLVHNLKFEVTYSISKDRECLAIERTFFPIWPAISRLSDEIGVEIQTENF